MEANSTFGPSLPDICDSLPFLSILIKWHAELVTLSLNLPVERCSFTQIRYLLDSDHILLLTP